MPLTDHQGDAGGRAMPARKAWDDAGGPADSSDDEHGPLSRIIDEIASLREENSDLRGRVRRLESRSGRGIMHPCESSDDMTPRSL